jgi:hypothetical protein
MPTAAIPATTTAAIRLFFMIFLSALMWVVR